MTKEALFEQIQQKKSFLCVGLDTDIKKIPTHLLDQEDPIFEFNKQIIDATKDFAVAYKPNIAFYEAMGASGWASLEKTINYIPQDIFTIADAKRGDIGNTSSLYARAFFDNMNFDSVTVAPYMGSDSVKPFLEFKDKWVILLGVTSNEGGKDFQFLESEGKPLYQHVMESSSQWGSDQNMMYVVGATRPEYLQDIRKIIPDHFLLVPGVGAQGGDLEAVCKNGMNDQCGLLINSTRGIIYASSGEDFAGAAHIEAKKLQAEMAPFVESLK
ncbi:orotidine-5'-phosphate decarboxylase [Reichenbachiella sp.]|uniref:orotidine-5'-phosphate decarboxylase n=1 Tax=Reichenbachiella sp. TaxID=2184521 RepID=UPI003B5C9E66